MGYRIGKCIKFIQMKLLVLKHSDPLVTNHGELWWKDKHSVWDRNLTQKTREERKTMERGQRGGKGQSSKGKEPNTISGQGWERQSAEDLRRSKEKSDPDEMEDRSKSEWDWMIEVIRRDDDRMIEWSERRLIRMAQYFIKNEKQKRANNQPNEEGREAWPGQGWTPGWNEFIQGCGTLNVINSALLNKLDRYLYQSYSGIVGDRVCRTGFAGTLKN